jgi:hypothetical protein
MVVHIDDGMVMKCLFLVPFDCAVCSLGQLQLSSHLARHWQNGTAALACMKWWRDVVLVAFPFSPPIRVLWMRIGFDVACH